MFILCGLWWQTNFLCHLYVLDGVTYQPLICITTDIKTACLQIFKKKNVSPFTDYQTESFNESSVNRMDYNV